MSESIISEVAPEAEAIVEEQSTTGETMVGEQPTENNETPEVAPVKEIPEAYELPEGLVALEGFDVDAFGKEFNLSQDEFNSLTGHYTKLEGMRMEAEQGQRVAAFREVISEKEQASFEAKARGTLGEDYELLRDAMSGSLSAPASVAKLVKQYIMKTEHNLTPQVQAAPALTEGDLREMMRDPRYKTDTDFRSRVSAGFAKLYN